MMQQVGHDGGARVLIHYTHEVAGEPRIACMPGMAEFHATGYHPNYQRTNDVRAVQCPACERTEAFIAATAALGLRVPHGR